MDSNQDNWDLEDWKQVAHHGRDLLLKANEYLIKSRDVIQAQQKAIAFWRMGAVIAWITTACILVDVFA